MSVNDKPTLNRPFFSIIIPTLNEEKFLPILLKDLTKQIWQDFEVIHVDGNSTDKTVEKSKCFAGDKLNIKILHCKKRNASVQRNMGAKKAVGEWIIFMDADNQLGPEFLLALRYRIAKISGKSNKLDVFSCLISLNAQDKKKSKNKIAQQTINMVLQSSVKSDKPRLFGALIGVRRSLARKVKFDPKITFSEDVEFVSRLVEKGYRYKLFRSPKYHYSMRRWDDKNLFITTVKSAVLQLKIFLGKDFEDFTDSEYDMSADRYKKKK